MNCPRCGTPNHPQAQQCVRCGLLFTDINPYQTSQHPSRPQPYWPSQGPAPASGGRWAGSGPEPQPPPTYYGNDPSARGADPYTDYGRGPMMPSPQNPPSRPAQRGPDEAWGAPPTRPPLPPGGPRLSRPRDVVPFDANSPRGGVMGARSAPASLYPGAALQNGRLRILGPYGPLRTALPEGSLTQWVAVDAGRRGDRVVVIELPFGSLPPREANAAREQLARRLIAISSHANLQKTFASFTEHGRHFLLLEYIEGTWLSDRIRTEGVIGEATALQYATVLLDALDFLARQSPPSVHGLIAPETFIIVHDERQICLVGWNIAIVASSINLTLPEIELQVAPGYTAPEQQRGQIEPRNDLYSLGATLYYALTGSDPSTRSAGIFPAIRQYNDSISPATEYVLNKAVRLVPVQRYQHATDMLLDVERASKGELPSAARDGRMEPLFRQGSAGLVTITAILSLLLVTVLVVILILRVRVSTTQGNAPPAPTATIDPTQSALYTQHDEGISTGRLIFDLKPLLDLSGGAAATPTIPGTLVVPPGVTQYTRSPVGAILAEFAGASAVGEGKYADAVTSFQRAVADDPTNAEARLYLANAQIEANGVKNVATIAVAADFASADIEVSRSVLRGVALAQDEINRAGLPGNGQLLIAIGSVGADASGSLFVAQYLTQLLTAGNSGNLLGIISWSPRNLTASSAETIKNSIKTIANAKVPLIAPIRTTDTIPVNPYFFHLSGSMLDQTGGMIQAVMSEQPSRVIIVYDPTNAQDIEANEYAKVGLKKLLGDFNVIDTPLDPAAPQPYAQAVKNTVFQGANAVLYLGNPDSLVGMAIALNQKGNPLPIIAGPTADSPIVIGQGSGTAAQLAATNQSAMKTVKVVSITDGGEWTYLKKQNAAIQTPSFFDTYANSYTSPQFTATPDVSAILSYDAVNLVIKSLVKNNFWTASKIPSPDNVRAALETVTDQNSFQGISGRIAYGKDGSSSIPDNRSMFVKDVALSSDTDAQGNQLLKWSPDPLVPIIPKGSFCVTTSGPTPCVPN